MGSGAKEARRARREAREEAERARREREQERIREEARRRKAEAERGMAEKISAANNQLGQQMATDTSMLAEKDATIDKIDAGMSTLDDQSSAKTKKLKLI